MKIFNPGRFCVEIGDELSYNNKAIEWVNSDLKCKNKPLWPSAEELNKKVPKVLFFDFVNIFNKKTSIKLKVVYNDNKYTGLSGVISSTNNADIWFLYLNGTFLYSCPYPLFLKVKK